MGARSYTQHCGLAQALDLIGERWTMLILRELIGGPKRYKALLAGLPHIGTGMLATRLKSLQEHGLIVHTTLPPPADAPVYELTELGRELEPILVGLTRFGQRWLEPLGEGEEFQPSWFPVAILARFDPIAARGVNDTYELDVGEGIVWTMRVKDGELDLSEGRPAEPDASLRGDARTLLAIFSRELHPRDAAAAGRFVAEGDPEALLRCSRIFPSPPAAVRAA